MKGGRPETREEESGYNAGYAAGIRQGKGHSEMMSKHQAREAELMAQWAERDTHDMAMVSLCVFDKRVRALLWAYGFIPAEMVRPRYGAGAAATTVGVAEQISMRRCEWRSLVERMRSEARTREELASAIEGLLSAQDE